MYVLSLSLSLYLFLSIYLSLYLFLPLLSSCRLFFIAPTTYMLISFLAFSSGELSGCTASWVECGGVLEWWRERENIAPASVTGGIAAVHVSHYLWWLFSGDALFRWNSLEQRDNVLGSYLSVVGFHFTYAALLCGGTCLCQAASEVLLCENVSS